MPKKKIFVASSAYAGSFSSDTTQFPENWDVTITALIKHQADDTHPYWRDVVKQWEKGGIEPDGIIIYDETVPKDSPSTNILMKMRQDLREQRENLPAETQQVIDSIDFQSIDPIKASQWRDVLERSMAQMESNSRAYIDETIGKTEHMLLDNPSTAEGVAMTKYFKSTTSDIPLVAAHLRHGKDSEYAVVLPDAVHRLSDIAENINYRGKNPNPVELLQQLFLGINHSAKNNIQK